MNYINKLNDEAKFAVELSVEKMNKNEQYDFYKDIQDAQIDEVVEIFVQNAHLLVDNSHEEYGDKIIKILVKLTRIVKTKAGLKC